MFKLNFFAICADKKYEGGWYAQIECVALFKYNAGEIMRESGYLKYDNRNIQKLMDIPLFQDFEIASLGELLKISKIREYETGERIIKEGEKDPFVYFLYSGRVRIIKHGEILADLRRCGDVFGEMEMLGGFERSASAFAIEETVCLATDASKIVEITGRDRLAFRYILYRKFAQIVAERLKYTTNELMKAKEELARLKGREEMTAA